MLVTSDKHLLDIDEDALLLAFNEADLVPVHPAASEEFAAGVALASGVILICCRQFSARRIIEAKSPEPDGGCNVERSRMRRAIH